MKYFFIPTLLNILLLSPSAYAVDEKRLDEVAQRGAHVMPFDLDLSMHIFAKSAQGGIQHVIVKDPTNTQQIKLIQEHLAKIADEFQQSNFSDPEKVHGDTMPGLAVLRQAKAGDINIVYKGLANGAEITYSTNDPKLISAIHQWFDAQLKDHSRHAISGHAQHMMHHK